MRRGVWFSTTICGWISVAKSTFLFADMWQTHTWTVHVAKRWFSAKPSPQPDVQKERIALKPDAATACKRDLLKLSGEQDD
jgi:hypothetical protein